MSPSQVIRIWPQFYAEEIKRRGLEGPRLTTPQHLSIAGCLVYAGKNEEESRARGAPLLESSQPEYDRPLVLLHYLQPKLVLKNSFGIETI